MTEQHSPEGTYRFFLEQFKSPGYMRTPISSGFFGVVFGMTADEAVESWMLACRMPLLLDPQSPDDVLPYIAEDRRLPRYSTETAAQHRQRLWDAWNIYLEAGCEEAIEKQILAAGWGPDVFLGDYKSDVPYKSDYFYKDRGAFVEFRPDATGPRGESPPYRTQFWVVFNEGFHPVTGLPIPWGQFVWGDTSEGVWGPRGYSRTFAKEIIGIIKKWKPSDHVFRGFTFIINNIPYKSDILYKSDVVYKGAIEVPIYS